MAFATGFGGGKNGRTVKTETNGKMVKPEVRKNGKNGKWETDRSGRVETGKTVKGDRLVKWDTGNCGKRIKMANRETL